MHLNTIGIQCHLLTLQPQCCFDSATQKSEDSDLDQSYHEVSVKYFGGYKLLVGTTQCFHLQFDFLRTSILDSVLQHNDRFCIYIDVHIYTPPLKYSQLTPTKARPDFGPESFGISNNIHSLVLKGNFHLAAWKISKSLCSARLERDYSCVFRINTIYGLASSSGVATACKGSICTIRDDVIGLKVSVLYAQKLIYVNALMFIHQSFHWVICQTECQDFVYMYEDECEL